MTPADATSRIRAGELSPVYVLLGEEIFLRDEVFRSVRDAVTKKGIPGLNNDDFTAGQNSIGDVLSALRTLPMMSSQRLVVVRELEKWESSGTPAKEGASKSRRVPAVAPLDQLASYVEAPIETSVLILLASKINGRRRLISMAKKRGYLVDCSTLHKSDLPRWVKKQVASRGGKISGSAAELLAEVKGPELSPINDAIERLCLFANGRAIDEGTLSEVMPIVRPATIWELVDAVARRDVGGALAHLAKVFEPKDRGLPIVGILAWSTRQLIRFQSARAAGKAPADAAKAAGAPPFRANALDRQLKSLPAPILRQWVLTLRNVDIALKGGSKRAPRAILESALIDLCQRSP